jgi:hypothetical protein
MGGIVVDYFPAFSSCLKGGQALALGSMTGPGLLARGDELTEGNVSGIKRQFWNRHQVETAERPDRVQCRGCRPRLLGMSGCMWPSATVDWRLGPKSQRRGGHQTLGRPGSDVEVAADTRRGLEFTDTACPSRRGSTRTWPDSPKYAITSTRSFYQDLIKTADDRYEAHLKRLERPPRG